MKLRDYANNDGLALAQLIKQGEVSKQEVVEAAALAIDHLNPKLNFIAHLTPGEVERALSDKTSSGVFAGVPFLIKAAAIKDQPFDLGSRLGVGHIAQEDAEITRRFKQAGVTIMGISTMPEWGNSATTESVLYGPTRNPWNTHCMPGGSSGGAAAAVAAGAVPVAHAGDGGGSIRTPAACCGLVGLKPTRARTPGTHGGPFSLGVEHIVSRTVRDTAAMLDSIHGPEAGAVYYALPPQRPYLDELRQPPKPLRIAFSSKSPSGSKVHADCIRGVEQAAKLCDSLGHQVEEVALPYQWEPLLEAFLALWSYRHPYSVKLVEEITGKRSGPDTRETCNLAMLAHAEKMSLMDFDCHLRHLEQVCLEVGRFFHQFDIFISPVNTDPALKLGEMNVNAPDLTAELWGARVMSNHSVFTPIFNATGQPAISLPLYQSDEGLPIGVQFAAPHSDEGTLLQLAGQLEQALPWIHRKPNVSIF